MSIFNIGYILFAISFIGYVLNKNNIILVFIILEILLVGCSLNIIAISQWFNDVTGFVWVVTILIIAGCESVIGLSILIIYYRIKGNINLDES